MPYLVHAHPLENFAQLGLCGLCTVFIMPSIFPLVELGLHFLLSRSSVTTGAETKRLISVLMLQ